MSETRSMHLGNEKYTYSHDFDWEILRTLENLVIYI
jgi:hypothetical protein